MFKSTRPSSKTYDRQAALRLEPSLGVNPKPLANRQRERPYATYQSHKRFVPTLPLQQSNPLYNRSASHDPQHHRQVSAKPAVNRPYSHSAAGSRHIYAPDTQWAPAQNRTVAKSQYVPVVQSLEPTYQVYYAPHLHGRVTFWGWLWKNIKEKSASKENTVTMSKFSIGIIVLGMILASILLMFMGFIMGAQMSQTTLQSSSYNYAADPYMANGASIAPSLEMQSYDPYATTQFVTPQPVSQAPVPQHVAPAAVPAQPFVAQQPQFQSPQPAQTQQHPQQPVVASVPQHSAHVVQQVPHASAFQPYIPTQLNPAQHVAPHAVQPAAANGYVQHPAYANAGGVVLQRSGPAQGAYPQ